MQCSPTQWLSVVNQPEDQAVLTVYTSRHFVGMLFASKAIIYLNEERGRAARNNFFKTMCSLEPGPIHKHRVSSCRSKKVADWVVNSGIFLQFVNR